MLVDELVRALNEIRQAGTGMLVVEQHLSLVRRTTDRFVILSKGRRSDRARPHQMANREIKLLMAV